MNRIFNQFFIAAIAVFVFAFTPASIKAAQSAASSHASAPMLKLWLEAQIDDGAETTWKFYLYGNESEGSGEMTCSYGSTKYEGTWTKTSVGGNTAYLFQFPESTTPTFNGNDGNSFKLTSSAIVMTGQYRGYFAVDTYMGQAVPFGNYTAGNATRQKFECEILD